MKIRTDFVTNSSSSSFIFGVPGKRTIQIPNVVDTIREIAKNIMNVVESLDDITTEIEDIKEDMQDIRLGTAEYEAKSRVEHFLEERKDIEATVETLLKQNNIELEYWDFLCGYTNNYQIDKIKEIAESTDKWSLPIQSSFIDLRRVTNKDDAENVYEAVYWYEDKLSKESLNKFRSKEMTYEKSCDIAYKELGEVLVYGECGYIPDMIVDQLYDKANCGCNHMG